MATKADVLVVEDDDVINQLIGVFLTQAGFGYRSAVKGSTALREAQEQVPGLVVLDIMLPDVDGFEVCCDLKKCNRTAAVPVIMVSALADEENRQKGLRCGAAEYIAKPFDPDRLMLTIERYSRMNKDGSAEPSST